MAEMGKRLFYVRYHETRHARIEKHVYAKDIDEARAKCTLPKSHEDIELIGEWIEPTGDLRIEFLVEDADRDFGADRQQRREDNMNGVGKW